MKTLTLDEKQIMELEQILVDEDAQAALKFVRDLIAKAKKAEQSHSCDQSARSF